jgi:hypothetical protein
MIDYTIHEWVPGTDHLEVTFSNPYRNEDNSGDEAYKDHVRLVGIPDSDDELSQTLDELGNGIANKMQIAHQRALNQMENDNDD